MWRVRFRAFFLLGVFVERTRGMPRLVRLSYIPLRFYCAAITY